MSDLDPNKLAEALATVLSGDKPKKTRTKKAKGTGKGRVKLTDEQRAAFMAQNDTECVKVFTAAGYSDVKPRENVLTYKRWLEKGRIVKKGEKSHRVGSFNLFHFNQTDAVPEGTATVQ
jgi:hypothetical protein